MTMPRWPALLVVVLTVAACGSVTPISRDGGGGTGGGGQAGMQGDGSTAVDSGDQCSSDQDCKQYSDGVGACCGVCIPAGAPQPATVQCLIPCTTPIKSCGCSNHQCVASTS